MKRSNPKEDIEIESSVGEVFLITKLEEYKAISVYDRAPKKVFSGWDVRWTDKSSSELKNDYLNLLTGNVAFEQKCLDNTTADSWYYGVPYLNINDLEQKEITSTYNSLKYSARKRLYDDASDNAKKLVMLLRKNKVNLVTDIYEWNTLSLKEFVKPYRTVPSGDDFKALCHIVSKADIISNKIISLQDVANINPDYASLVFKKMSEEVQKQLTIASKKSNYRI